MTKAGLVLLVMCFLCSPTIAMDDGILNGLFESMGKMYDPEKPPGWFEHKSQSLQEGSGDKAASKHSPQEPKQNMKKKKSR